MAIFDSGYLLIDSKEDREEVAKILYRNGYSVSPVKTKKNDKTYYYLVAYERREQVVTEEVVS